MEKIIRDNFNGIESISYCEEGKFYDVVTKNVFISANRLIEIASRMAARDIEVNIVYLTGRLSYRIFM